METCDLFLSKARFEDWEDMYRNVWSHPETARYMLWSVTSSEAEAKARMERTMAWQRDHDVWTVYEKSGGQAIGYAGLEELSPGLWQETGIALGPSFVGRGYGRQLLELLMDLAARRGGQEFQAAVRSENATSKALLRSCGFAPLRTEPKTDPRNGRPYTREIYRRSLGETIANHNRNEEF